MSTSRADHPTLNYLPQASLPASTTSSAHPSPGELPAGGNAIRSPFILATGSSTMTPTAKLAAGSRSGAGSPSHDLASGPKFFSKRAREIQAQEGVVTSPWGPPTSGHSTPLRENIPESPTDGIPEFTGLPTPDSAPQVRRGRAGTVPSRFSPGGPAGPAAVAAAAAKSSRPTPSHSPFQLSSSASELDVSSTNAALLSRLRAGSMPQRTYPAGAAPFGTAVFSPIWGTGRERALTLASIASAGSGGPSSPTQSQFSKEGPAENDLQMRTLDYLGLADTPQPPRAQLVNPYLANIADIAKSANRFRSYSVNATEKYAAEEDEEYAGSGSLTPYEAQAQLHMQLAATNAAIQQHNLAVQAFASQASSNRPRARTAGVLDAPPSRLLHSYYPTPSRLDNSITAADLSDAREYEALPEAVAAMGLTNRMEVHGHGEETSIDGPTRALWLGSIPSSTTVSTLTEMFKAHGPIISARVLTHKNCGFVNFERLDSAMAARALLNNKEIFPGSGPIRINFAKPPSPVGTPGPDGSYPSPSPDPYKKSDGQHNTTNGSTSPSQGQSSSPVMPGLPDMKDDILKIVLEFGATKDDQARIGSSLDRAITYDDVRMEIPAIPEPTHDRVHDAPKLRDIRKRIDNQSLSTSEIETIARAMLPEIAELSSDYLGNTVVQKLFEFCSDDVRDAMLAEIAPHMAEIGVHKNGTWAAQKIIDVCKTAKQKNLIVSNLKPFTVPLFLDQYGNYVLQCCLKFGSPYNDFIFETMLSQMWEVAQGRFGARAMRACLESHHATKDQQRMLAAAIALQSVRLATNANGALLLTWYLDTCTFPSRRTILAPQLVPHLVHLCTHKVAYLTVLKVINQKMEPEARDATLEALFFSQNNDILQSILSDHACGSMLIFKVITTPFFDGAMRARISDHIRTVLLQIKAQPSQGYKRLMDEVGLSTRNNSVGPGRDHSNHNPTQDRHRPGSNHSQMGGHMNPQFPNQFYPSMNQQPFDMGGPTPNGGVDAGVSPFTNFNLQAPVFPPAMPQMAMPPLQYGHLLNRSNNYYPNMQQPGYVGAAASTDHYRHHQGMPNQSPSSMSPMTTTASFGPPGFGNAGMGMGSFGGGYGGMPMNGMHSMGFAQQEQPVNTRRGRQR